MSTLKDTTTKALDAEREDIAALRDDIAALRADFKSLMSNAGDLLRGRADQAVAKGRNLADEAEHEIEAAKDSFESQVRRNPMAALGIAFGAGVVLSLLGRK